MLLAGGAPVPRVIADGGVIGTSLGAWSDGARAATCSFAGSDAGCAEGGAGSSTSRDGGGGAISRAEAGGGGASTDSGADAMFFALLRSHGTNLGANGISTSH